MSKRKQDVQGSARETSFVGDGSSTVAAMDQNRRATAAQLASRKIRQAKGHRRPGTTFSSSPFAEASSVTGASDQQSLQTSALSTPGFSFAQPPSAPDSPFSFSGGNQNVPHTNNAAAPPQPSSGTQSFSFTPPATGFSFSTPAPTNNPFNAANGPFAPSSTFNPVNAGFSGSIFNFSPSTAIEPSRPVEQSTSATPFSFGPNAPSNVASSPKPFGFNSTSTSEAPTSAKPFSFGPASTTEASSSPKPLSFNSASASEAPASSKPSNFGPTGTTEASSSPKPFGFNSPSTSQPPSASSLVFNFGQTQSSTTSSSLNFNTPAFSQPPTTSNLFNFNSPSASQTPTSTGLFNINRPSTSQAPSSLRALGSNPLGTSQAPSTLGGLNSKLPSTSQSSSSSGIFGSKPPSTLQSSSTSGLFGLNTQAALQPSSSPGPFKLEQSTSNPFNQAQQEPASAQNPFSSLLVTPPVITSASPTDTGAQSSSEPSHLKPTPLAQGGTDADLDTAMSSESPELSPQKGRAPDNALMNTHVDSVTEKVTTPVGTAVEVNDIAGSETPQTQPAPSATATDTDSHDGNVEAVTTPSAPASFNSFQPASPPISSPQPPSMSPDTVNGRISPSPTAAKKPWDGIGVSDFPFDVQVNAEPRGPEGYPPSPAPPHGYEVPPERQWEWDEQCRIVWLDDFIKDAIAREESGSLDIAWLCRYYLEKRAHIDKTARKAQAAANKRKSAESYTDGEYGRRAKRRHADVGDVQPTEDDEAGDTESLGTQDSDGRYVLTGAGFELVPRSPSSEPATNGQHTGRDLKRKAEEQPDSGDDTAPSIVKKSRLESARPQLASSAAGSIFAPSSQSASIFQNIIGETTNAANGAHFRDAVAAATAAAAAAAMPAPPKFGAASLAKAASSPNGTGPEGADDPDDDDKPDNDSNDEAPSVFTQPSRFAPGQIAPYNIFGHLAQANHDGVDGGGNDDNDQQG